VAALREAAIWERLSLGLNAVFLLWLAAIERRDLRRVASSLADARRTRASVSGFSELSINGEPAVVARAAFASIRRSLALRERLGSEAVARSEREAFDLGAALLGREPIATVMQRLEGRHMSIKADEAWLRPGRDGVELARDPGDRWELPQVARLHPYRLWAFGQIVADLRQANR